MKKMLCIMLSLIMVLGLFSGCDALFTSGDEGGAAGGSTGDIKMTDKYTFTDPTDLTFETRYALYCDENSAAVSTAAGYGVKAMLIALQASGMISETTASAYIEYYKSYSGGTPVE